MCMDLRIILQCALTKSWCQHESLAFSSHPTTLTGWVELNNAAPVTTVDQWSIKYSRARSTHNIASHHYWHKPTTNLHSLDVVALDNIDLQWYCRHLAFSTSTSHTHPVEKGWTNNKWVLGQATWLGLAGCCYLQGRMARVTTRRCNAVRHQ